MVALPEGAALGEILGIEVETLRWPKDPMALINGSVRDKADEQRLWDLARRYLAGRQWEDSLYDRAGEFRVRKQVAGRTLIVINRLLNLYRNVVAKLSMAYPNVTILPASGSEEDVVKAKASELALRYYWHRDGLKDTLSKMVQYLCVDGTAALHTYYDPDSTDVRTDVVSAYDLFWEEDVEDPEHSDWLAVRKFVTRETIEEVYPEIEMPKIGSAVETTSQLGTKRALPKSRIELFDIYWRDGRHAQLVGGKYAWRGKFPVQAMPVQVVRYTPLIGRAWGVGLLTPLLDSQWELNKLRSQIIDNVDLMSNPVWLIPLQAQIGEHQFTNRPGEKVYYNPSGGKPDQIQAAGLPNYVFDTLARLEQDFERIPGVNKLSVGERVPGIRSGKAIEVLTEKDATQLNTTQEEIEKGVRRMAKVALLLMREFYTEPKYVRMLDSSGGLISDWIGRTEIVEDPEVFFDAKSLFRDEALDRDAQVLRMLEAGFLKKEDAVHLLSTTSGISPLVMEKVRAMAHMMDLLDAAKTGRQIEIFTTDDLEAARKVFGGYVSSNPEFYTLDPLVQAYLRDVVVEVSTFGMPRDQAQVAAYQKTVFPRPEPPELGPGQRAESLVLMESEAAQAQKAQQMASADQQKMAVQAAQAYGGGLPPQGMGF